MANRIVVYGHGDRSKYGFPDEDSLRRYLAGELFTKYRGRYHFSQAKKADIIVISRDGLAYGHLLVDDIVNPTLDDENAYPRVKKVYIIGATALYQNPVKLVDLDIRRYQWGKTVTDEQFANIKSRAGKISEHFP
jgi:hypothetical protein